MGLRFVRENDQGHIIAEERLYLTEDRRLVAEGDPDARWLYCTPGSRISEHNAEVFGLKAKPKPANKAVETPDEDKAALLAEAESLGVKVHPNAKAATIRQRIEEAKAAAEDPDGEDE